MAEEKEELFKRYASRVQDYRPGKVIANRYKIVTAIGSGGMGSVLLVEDTRRRKKSLRALKLLNVPVTSVDEFLPVIARFREEVSILQKVELQAHPNIVSVYNDEESDDGNIFYVMEYIEGESLEDYVKKKGPLHVHDARTILIKLADILRTLHDLKIKHRDLKPDNILVIDKGSELDIKLIDFGIAKDARDAINLTRDHTQLGTVKWMSPEQCEGREATELSDIYSFGLIAYYLITGEHPFLSREREEALDFSELGIRKAHIETEPPAISKYVKNVPSWYSGFVSVCLKKSPGDRYQDIEAVSQILKNSKAGFHWRSVRGKVLAGVVAMFAGIITLYGTYPMEGLKGSGVYNHKLQEKVLDVLFNLRGSVKPPDDVAIVKLDDKSKLSLVSEDEIHNPWPRKYIAQLIQEIAEQEPKAIIVDIVFRGLWDKDEEDDALAKAISESGAYLASVIEYTEAPTGELVATEIKPNDKFLRVSSGSFLANLKVVGGRVRRFKHGLGTEGGITPMASLIYGEKASQEVLPSELDYLNFYGPAGTIESVSADEILDPRQTITTSKFKDRFVFISKQIEIATEDVPRDKFLTSYSEVFTPGAEVHATALANILTNNWIRRLELKREALINVVLAVLFVFYMIVERKRGRYLIAIALPLILLAVSYLLFVTKSILFAGWLGYFVGMCFFTGFALSSNALKIVRR